MYKVTEKFSLETKLPKNFCLTYKIPRNCCLIYKVIEKFVPKKKRPVHKIRMHKMADKDSHETKLPKKKLFAWLKKLPGN